MRKLLAVLLIALPVLALAARDSSGNYTLPSTVNPVSPGQPITSNWANTTLNDIRDALTDSLSRTGKGGMSVPFQFAEGSAANPILTFTLDQSSGLYHTGGSASGKLRFSLLGNDVLRLEPTGLTLISRAADGASAVGAIVDTGSAWTTAGAKLLSLRNNGVEKASVRLDGFANFAGASLAGDVSMPSGYLYLSQSNTDQAIYKSNGALVIGTTTAHPVVVQQGGVNRWTVDTNGNLYSNDTQHDINNLGGVTISKGGGNLALTGVGVQSIGKSNGPLNIGTATSDPINFYTGNNIFANLLTDGTWNFNSHRLTSVATPSADTDAATKGYVTTAISSYVDPRATLLAIRCAGGSSTVVSQIGIITGSCSRSSTGTYTVTVPGMTTSGLVTVTSHINRAGTAANAATNSGSVSVNIGYDDNSRADSDFTLVVHKL